MAPKAKRMDGVEAVDAGTVAEFRRLVESGGDLVVVSGLPSVRMSLPFAIALRNEIAHREMREVVAAPSVRLPSFRVDPEEVAARLVRLPEAVRRVQDDVEFSRFFVVDRIWSLGALLPDGSPVPTVDVSVEWSLTERGGSELVDMDEYDFREHVDAMTFVGFYDGHRARPSRRIRILDMVVSQRLRKEVRGLRFRDLWALEGRDVLRRVVYDRDGIVEGDRSSWKGTSSVDPGPSRPGSALRQAASRMSGIPAPLDLSHVDVEGMTSTIRRLGFHPDGNVRLLDRSRADMRKTVRRHRSMRHADFALADPSDGRIVDVLRLRHRWKKSGRDCHATLDVDLDRGVHLDRNAAGSVAVVVVLAVSTLVQSALRFAGASHVMASVGIGTNISPVVFDTLRNFDEFCPRMFVDGPNGNVVDACVDPIRRDRLDLRLTRVDEPMAAS